jgi:hypothetical protein
MRSLRAVVVSRGRKPVLTLFEKLAVGGECERLWQALAEQQAMARYRNRPNLRDVKKLQADQPTQGSGLLGRFLRYDEASADLISV